MRFDVIYPQAVFYKGKVSTGLAIEISKEGYISRIDNISAFKESKRLEGLLLPGFVNAHSHSFQVALRGIKERFTEKDDFWKWRKKMYNLVTSLSPQRMYDIYFKAFSEMKRAGITTVGEFHYLHHISGRRWIGDEVVLAAAKDANIRIVLLSVCYLTGDFGAPPHEGQKHFISTSVKEFFDAIERVGGKASKNQSIGVAPHSVRTVPVKELSIVVKESQYQRLPIHIHLEEQSKEVEEARKFYGKRPVELLFSITRDLRNVTAIHLTQTPPELIDKFARLGGNLVVCPITEANLGDGVPDLKHSGLMKNKISLGTDSCLNISMLEEARWLELTQRLKFRRRGILVDETGELEIVLLNAMTLNGANTLSVVSGSIEVGAYADFVLVKMTDDVEDMLSALIFSGDRSTITATAVGGEWEFY